MVMIEPRIDSRTELVTKTEAAAHRLEALEAAAAWWQLEARLRVAVAEEPSPRNR